MARHKKRVKRKKKTQTYTQEFHKAELASAKFFGKLLSILKCSDDINRLLVNEGLDKLSLVDKNSDDSVHVKTAYQHDMSLNSLKYDLDLHQMWYNTMLR